MRKIQLNTIKGLEHLKDYYFIQEDGTLYGYQGKELVNSLDRYGYIRNKLSSKIGKKHFRRHRLVAMAFVPNLESKPQVNHIDEDKTNNHVLNLEWSTAAENSNHGTRTERSAQSRSKAVIGTCIKTGKQIEFSSGVEADRQGFNQGAISRCCHGKLNIHKGFKWQFKESV